MTTRKPNQSTNNSLKSVYTIYVIASNLETARMKRIVEKPETQALMKKEGYSPHPIEQGARRVSVSIGTQFSVQANYGVKAVVLANADHFETAAKLGAIMLIPNWLFSLYMREIKSSKESEVRKAQVTFQLPKSAAQETMTLTFSHLCVVQVDRYVSPIAEVKADNQDEHEAELLLA